MERTGALEAVVGATASHRRCIPTDEHDRKAYREACRVYNDLTSTEEAVRREQIEHLLNYLLSEGVSRNGASNTRTEGRVQGTLVGSAAGMYVWAALAAEGEPKMDDKGNETLRQSYVIGNLLDMRHWTEKGNLARLTKMRKRMEAGEDITLERRKMIKDDAPLVTQFVTGYLNGNRPPVELVDALQERHERVMTQHLRDYAPSHYEPPR